MRILLAAIGLCLALNASSLPITINFSGTVTSATAGAYNFQIGEAFTGSIRVDADGATYSDRYLGGGINFEGRAMPFPNYLISGLTILPDRISILGEAQSQFGGYMYGVINLNLEDGVVTGGDTYFNSGALWNSGSFGGAISPAAVTASVPDQTNAFALLLIGIVAMFGFHGFNASACKLATETPQTAGRDMP